MLSYFRPTKNDESLLQNTSNESTRLEDQSPPIYMKNAICVAIWNGKGEWQGRLYKGRVQYILNKRTFYKIRFFDGDEQDTQAYQMYPSREESNAQSRFFCLWKAHGKVRYYR